MDKNENKYINKLNHPDLLGVVPGFNSYKLNWFAKP